MSEHEPFKIYDEMPVILTARQYRALDEALHLLEARFICDDNESVDFSDDPGLEQVFIRLACATLGPWENPANKPILSRVGMCFKGDRS